MGASQNKLSSKNLKETHNFDKEIDDPRFGHIQIYQNVKDAQFIMVKEKFCHSIEEHKKLL